MIAKNSCVPTASELPTPINVIEKTTVEITVMKTVSNKNGLLD